MEEGGSVQRQMPIGVDDFQKLREKNYYFVDKTDFIRQLIDGHSNVTLLTRPRRFGKTLTLSMVDWFFSLQKEKKSQKLFQGLSIEKAGTFYMEHRGKYPVLFLSLKNIGGLNWGEMLEYWKQYLQELFLSCSELESSDRIQQALLKNFQLIIEQKANLAGMAGSLALLLRMLHQHYQKQVILLIDEYDAPVQAAWEGGFYRECISFMRQFLGNVLKGNPDLDFAVITGVLRIAKESIFSGLNNLKVCSVLQDAYGDVFGFTRQEVKTMAEDLGQTAKLPEIREWYDGYRIGGAEIYNPWSVLNYFDEAQVGDYWVNTSGNWIIRSMLQHLRPETENALYRLLQGSSIMTGVQESVIYEDIGRNEDALFTMLLTTGYLTAVQKKRGLVGLLCEVKIPNREVQDVYRMEIIERMKGSLSSARLETMLQNLLSGRAESFSQDLEQYIRDMASTWDTGNRESFYHGFLLGLTALLVPEYQVESNRESGYGRFDLAIFPKNPQKSGVILEFKTASSKEQLQEKAREALQQIAERQYDTAFQNRGIAKVWKYGIAFCGKDIAVKREK